jgi:hypothetical protein
MLQVEQTVEKSTAALINKGSRALRDVSCRNRPMTERESANAVKIARARTVSVATKQFDAKCTATNIEL